MQRECNFSVFFWINTACLGFVVETYWYEKNWLQTNIEFTFWDAPPSLQALVEELEFIEFEELTKKSLNSGFLYQKPTAFYLEDHPS